MSSFSSTDHVTRVKPRVRVRFLVVVVSEEAAPLWGESSTSLLEEGSAIFTEKSG